MGTPTSRLPAAWVSHVQRESIPQSLVALCRRLPAGLGLRVAVPSVEEVPPAWVRRLVKLTLLVPALALECREAADGPHVEIERRSPPVEVSPVALDPKSATDIEATLLDALSRLLSSAELADIAHEMAGKEVMLGSLQEITRSMLATTDVDRALYAMLSGITAGQGLGFNRAAVFSYDASRRVFVGQKAIGPYDEAEAHRIWEDIERQGKSIGDLIEDYTEQNFDSRFSQFVRTLSIDLEESAQLRALVSHDRAMLLEPSPDLHPTFRALGVRGAFALAGIFARGRLLGLAFADNAFSGRAIGPDRLSSFEFYIEQTALVWENLELLSRIEAQALSDPLTGLSNRRAFETELTTALTACEGAGQPCSLWLLDVDHFKAHNDEGGHDAGDELLLTLGRLLRETARSGEVTARLGGDEFAVLLPSVAKPVARARALAFGAAAESAGVRISIGGASFPDDAATPVTLLKAADTQLYEAKRAGRLRAAFPGASPESYSPPGR